MIYNNLKGGEKMNIELMKNRRKELGLTQQQLADLCGLSKNTIYNYENGKFEPTTENLEIISKKLKIDITELIGKDLSFDFLNYDDVKKKMKIKLSKKIHYFFEKDILLRKLFLNSPYTYMLLTQLEEFHQVFFGWSDYFQKVIVFEYIENNCYFIDFNNFAYAISNIVLMIQRLDLIIFDENSEQKKANFENILKLEQNKEGGSDE